MPAAARLGDMSTGHAPPSHYYPPRAAQSGSPTVFINGIAAHRVGDTWVRHFCTNTQHKNDFHDGNLAQGSPTVFVNGVALGRIGDNISCGDSVAQGSPNVFVNG